MAKKIIKAILGLGLVGFSGYLIYNGFTWIGGAIGIVGMIIGGTGALCILAAFVVLIIKSIFTDSSW